MKSRIILMAALFGAILSFNAYACGDSLYRIGKGMSYRVYSAPLPGNLLVFDKSESARQLADDLAKAGHGVQLVGSEDELTSALNKGGYDVIIAPFSERDRVEATASASANADISFLPVAMNGEEQRVAKQSYGRVMVPDNELKHYLKAIHRTLKSKA